MPLGQVCPALPNLWFAPRPMGMPLNQDQIGGAAHGHPGRAKTEGWPVEVCLGLFTLPVSSTGPRVRTCGVDALSRHSSTGQFRWSRYCAYNPTDQPRVKGNYFASLGKSSGCSHLSFLAALWFGACLTSSDQAKVTLWGFVSRPSPRRFRLLYLRPNR